MDEKYINSKRMQNLEKQNKNSHAKLKQDVKKKMNTTMIAALAAVEENLGYLWGFDKEGELTEQELEFKEIWEFTRQQILDKGNSQIRAISDEIDNYTITWNQYQYKFTFRKD